RSLPRVFCPRLPEDEVSFHRTTRSPRFLARGTICPPPSREIFRGRASPPLGESRPVLEKIKPAIAKAEHRKANWKGTLDARPSDRSTRQWASELAGGEALPDFALWRPAICLTSSHVTPRRGNK